MAIVVQSELHGRGATTRAALPLLAQRGGGAIVTVSSVNAFLPDPGIIDYCAAKAALTNFSKALSKEVGPKGIRMNTVSPGPVETALWLGPNGVAATVAKTSGVDFETAKQQVVASQGGFATGRFTRPDEVADLVSSWRAMIGQYHRSRLRHRRRAD